MRVHLQTITIWITLNLVTITSAQSPVPQPDHNGDYFSNEAPLKQPNPPAKLQAGSLWQVISTKLNCRRAPGLQQPVIRQYQQGAILVAEVGRGGSDEVLLNAKDANGQPWMAVRGRNDTDQCYVRANRQFIQPLTKPRSHP